MIHSRSVGVKLIVVCGLAVAMTVPALFISGIVAERTARATDVVQQISASSGGQQTFLGPALVIPYKQRTGPRDAYVVFPASGSAVLKTVT
jgi:inner membrane protein